MNLLSAFTISICSAHRFSDWATAIAGVGFVFIGGYNLREQGEGMGDRNSRGNQLVIKPGTDKPSGRYKLRTAVPT